MKNTEMFVVNCMLPDGQGNWAKNNRHNFYTDIPNLSTDQLVIVLAGNTVQMAKVVEYKGIDVLSVTKPIITSISDMVMNERITRIKEKFGMYKELLRYIEEDGMTLFEFYTETDDVFSDMYTTFKNK